MRLRLGAFLTMLAAAMAMGQIAAQATTESDLTPTAFNAPAAAVATTIITITWTITNQGTTSTPSTTWVDRVYFSTDTVVDGADPVLRTLNRPASLAAGASYTQTTTVTVPSRPAGDYYLLLRTDHSSVIAETDETNNDAASPLTVTTPDLVPTGFSAPASVSTKEAVSFSFTITNQGTGDAAASWSDTIYISTDTTIGGDTSVRGTTRSTPLAAGGSYTVTLNSVTIPNLAAGNYYFLLKTDSGNARFEEDEVNNVVYSPVTITNPDLTPISLTVPSSAVTRESIVISWTVANQGAGIAVASWSDVLWLSTDTIIGGDVSMGSVIQTTSQLAGASYSLNRTLNVPNVVAGDYYVILKADGSGSGSLFESDESNNVMFVPITIANPNLVATSLTAPISVGTEEVVGVTYTVTNNGSGHGVPSWTDTIYLSTDATFGAGDIPLGSLTRSVSLPAGESYTTSRNITVPNTLEGYYYFIFRTDTSNSLFETDETDNFFSLGPVFVGVPDLVAVDLSAPESIATKESITVSWTVSNTGSASALPSWTDYIYISVDQTIGAGDTFITSQSRSVALPSDDSYSATKTLTFPNVPPGEYYLVMRSDATSGAGSVFEKDEANNSLAIPFRVKVPDLEVTLIPPNAPTSGPNQLTLEIKNLGDGKALPTWNDRIYFSNDAVIGTGDTLMHSTTRSAPIEAGDTLTESLTLSFPNKANGTYYLIARTDFSNQVYETNETNNIVALPIEIVNSDLIPLSLEAPTDSWAAGTFDVTFTVANVGGLASGTWSDVLSLSTDDVLDGSDSTVKGFTRSESVDAGSSYTVTGQITLPGAAAGNHYLILKTDSGGTIFESDENNNILAVPIHLTTKKLLVFGPTSGGFADATPGFVTTVWDPATWSGATTEQFAEFDAIAFGDRPICFGSPNQWSVAVANRDVWSAAITGNITINGTDPDWHGKSLFVHRSVQFAGAGSGTGLYVSLSCAYHSSTPQTVELLGALGDFEVKGVDNCPNQAHIVASHPSLTGVTGSYMSGWSCSAHEGFNYWPARFAPLVIIKDASTAPYTASDGTQGLVYVVASGARPIGLSLDPVSATAPVLNIYSITATLTDGVTEAPIVGRKIGFRVSSGPNAGSTGSCQGECMTDANGQVFWSYQGLGGAGNDAIQAWVDSNENGVPDPGEPQTTAEMNWTAAATVLEARPAIVDVSTSPNLALYFPNLEARLTTQQGAIVSGATVEFFAGGQLVCSATTDAEGIAACGGLLEEVTVILNLGYEARFEGGPSLLPSQGEGSLVEVDGTRVL